MDRLATDVRLGLRSLRNAPAFTATVIVTLALGIGLATAVLTVADAVLIHRMPVRDQERLVVLSGQAPSADVAPLSLEGAREFARRSRALERVALVIYNGAAPVTIRDEDRMSRLQRALVSGDFFSVLGTRPLLGRALTEEDDASGATPVLVLSYRAWQERYGGTTDVIGRRMSLHETGVAYTVVGVMPPGLDYPRGTDAWAAVRASIPAESMPYMAFDLLGRIAARATPAQARDEMTAYFHREGATPSERSARGVVRTLPELVLGDTRPALIAFGAAAGLLLLVTCLNVANLLLVRGVSRVRDAAVRVALGASHGRVARQLLTEHALLAVAGGALGTLVAVAAVRAFVGLAPEGLPRLDEIRVSGAVLAGALGITGLATLLFAIGPALISSRVELEQTLRSGVRQSAGKRSRLLRETIVASQVALALLALSAAALVTRSFSRLEHSELAFEPTHLLVAELAFRAGHHDTGPEQRALLEQLLSALEVVPGVDAASTVVAVPYASTRSWEGRPSLEGQSEDEAARQPLIDIEVVAPSFFASLRLPVLRGRGFSADDRKGAPAVVVLSQSAARHYWPGRDPIGKRVVVGPPTDAHAATVVGIVPDTRYRDLRELHPSIYFPLAQSFFPFAPTTLVIRSTRSPADLGAAVRGVLAETTPDIVLASVQSFDALIAGPLAQPRMNALLLAVFATAALVLSAVGLFGILALMVRQRTRELAVRMAMGASPADVARLVVRRGALLATVGATAGLLGALVLDRLLGALLFEISPTDATSLAVVTALVFAAATLASVLPARSSTRIEPAAALRAE